MMEDSSKRIKTIVSHLDGGSSPTADASSNQRPLRVCVTGAAGNIGYSVIFSVAKGEIFCEKRKIVLVLLDIPQAAEKLKGVRMEVDDCAFELVESVVATTDYQEAFENIDIVLAVGSFPRLKGMLRSDLLERNAPIFKGTGEALEKYANKNVKIVVVGNPANTNALCLSEYAPKIPKTNITALTRLDQNRAYSQIANHFKVPVYDVSDIYIWGNHSSTQFPDAGHAKIRRNGVWKSVKLDDDFNTNTFIPAVQQRGKAIIEARGLSSAASAANAIMNHCHSWLCNCNSDKVVSMGVPSDGSYGIPKGVVYSFPVTCGNGEFQIVQDLEISSFARERMDATYDELKTERKTALDFLSK